MLRSNIGDIGITKKSLTVRFGQREEGVVLDKHQYSVRIAIFDICLAYLLGPYLSKIVSAVVNHRNYVIVVNSVIILNAYVGKLGICLLIRAYTFQLLG